MNDWDINWVKQSLEELQRIAKEQAEKIQQLELQILELKGCAIPAKKHA